MLPAPCAGHCKVRIAFTGIHARIAQASRMAATPAGVLGRQRFAVILHYLPSRRLDSQKYPAHTRRRRLEKLTMRRVAKVKIPMPGAAAQKGAGCDGLRFKRFDWSVLVHLRSYD